MRSATAIVCMLVCFASGVSIKAGTVETTTDATPSGINSPADALLTVDVSTKAGAVKAESINIHDKPYSYTDDLQSTLESLMEMVPPPVAVAIAGEATQTTLYTEVERIDTAADAAVNASPSNDLSSVRWAAPAPHLKAPEMSVLDALLGMSITPEHKGLDSLASPNLSCKQKCELEGHDLSNGLCACLSSHHATYQCFARSEEGSNHLEQSLADCGSGKDQHFNECLSRCERQGEL